MVANQVIKAPSSHVLASLAARFELDPAIMQTTLKKTVFAACTNNEQFVTMCVVANSYGLNPLTKEIYAFPDKGGRVVPVVGVDGWIRIMQNNPAFDGIEFEETAESCTAVIYRKDRGHAIKVTEWLSECERNTEPWKKWPRRMLRNKALIQAARVAFGLSGIYEPDEAERIVEAQVAAMPTEAEKKPVATLRDVLKIDSKPTPAEVTTTGDVSADNLAEAFEAAEAAVDELPL